MQETFQNTWEGDVPILRRYCVDELDKVPEYEMRKWYWDMEWLPNGHKDEGAITAIGVYDNYTNKSKLYTWFLNLNLVKIQRFYLTIIRKRNARRIRKRYTRARP